MFSILKTGQPILEKNISFQEKGQRKTTHMDTVLTVFEDWKSSDGDTDTDEEAEN